MLLTQAKLSPRSCQINSRGSPGAGANISKWIGKAGQHQHDITTPGYGWERSRGSIGHPSSTKPEISSSSEAIPFLASYQAGVGHKVIM